jgi:hypothetical protein
MVAHAVRRAPDMPVLTDCDVAHGFSRALEIVSGVNDHDC